MAPFAYGNPDGSIFFGEETPCLEVAAQEQTALAISVALRQKFLESTSEPPTGLDMRLLKTPISGRFWDLRDHADVEENTLRALGKDFPQDADGILYRPRERPSGFCVSIVNGRILGRALQTSHYRYVWNGLTITQIYSFSDEGKIIAAESLGDEGDVLFRPLMQPHSAGHLRVVDG